MSGTTEVRLPDIGDFEDVEVIEIAVAPGAQIELDGVLIDAHAVLRGIAALHAAVPAA